MENIGVIVSLLGSLVAFAVGWGVLTTRVEEARKEAQARSDVLARQVSENEMKLKDLATKEHCQMKHSFLEQTLSEIKAQLREIRDALKEMSER